MVARLPTVPPGAPGSRLNARQRDRSIARSAAGPIDVLVIGGGITGVGVALDAATRGLSVVLIEQHDLAYGTSRWSSKLVHGGLRYLASGQVGIAWESAAERANLMGHIAPHLCRPLGQVLPLTAQVPPALVAVGLTAADAMRRLTGSTLPAPSRISGARARALTPAMTPAVASAALSWDGQLLDDARLVVSVARTAAAYGAEIITHAAVLDPSPSAVQVADQFTGETWQINARRVINATGAWADQVDSRVHLVRSRGTHLIVPAARLGFPTAALMAPVPGSTSRFVFALPQADDVVFIGLTDVATDAPLENPAATADEIDFLLDTINQVLATPLTTDDVWHTYSGYRPLLSDSAEHSADLSRRHAVLDGDLISVVGGKLTTYRRMAQDAVDLVSDQPCRTRRLPLIGAMPWQPDASRLQSRFGTEAPVVSQSTGGQSDAPIPGTPVLPCEITWATQAEGALTAADVERRLRVDLAPWWREPLADPTAAALAATAPLGR